MVGVEAELILKTGETLVSGQKIYAYDAVTVQAAGTKAIGSYSGPAISSSAAGRKIVVNIMKRYPEAEPPEEA